MLLIRGYLETNMNNIMGYVKREWLRRKGRSFIFLKSVAFHLECLGFFFFAFSASFVVNSIDFKKLFKKALITFAFITTLVFIFPPKEWKWFFQFLASIS